MAATTLAQALLAFQREGVALQKDAINPHFKNRYISLDSLTGTVLPVLNKCGLVVLQMPCESNGVPALTTRIIHADSGESVEATMPLMLQKQDPQSQGSAITYARRYALMSVLGLVADEDTDGHTARPGSAATQDRSGERPKAGVVEGAATAPTTPATNGDGPYISKGDKSQQQVLWITATENKVSKERVREIVLEICGAKAAEHTEFILKKDFDAVLDAIKMEGVPFG